MKRKTVQKESAEKGRKKVFKTAWGKRGLFIAGVGLLLLIAAGVVLLGPRDGGTAPAVPGASEVAYPVKEFQNGKARFYEYKTPDGIPIKYFVVKSSDGVIRAAFDACDVCWPAGKGYAQKGDFMVCRNCGRQFASVKVNEVTGGCNPGALKREVSGDRLVIKAKDILEGRKYFDFAKRG